MNMYIRKHALSPKYQFALSLIALGLVMFLWAYDKLEAFFSEVLGISTINTLSGVMGWVYFFIGIVILILGILSATNIIKVEKD